MDWFKAKINQIIHIASIGAAIVLWLFLDKANKKVDTLDNEVQRLKASEKSKEAGRKSDESKKDFAAKYKDYDDFKRKHPELFK